MTTDEYVNRLPAVSRQRPKFVATVRALTQGFVDLVNLYESLITINFNLDRAVGKQLDVIGSWVGIARLVYRPSESVEFAFDTDRRGWDQGQWNPGTQQGAAYVMPDDEYRVFIKVKIAANRWDGTVSEFTKILYLISPGTLVTDGFNMTASVSIPTNDLTPYLQLLLANGLLPIKPAGVSITYTFR